MKQVLAQESVAYEAATLGSPIEKDLQKLCLSSDIEGSNVTTTRIQETIEQHSISSLPGESQAQKPVAEAEKGEHLSTSKKEAPITLAATSDIVTTVPTSAEITDSMVCPATTLEETLTSSTTAEKIESESEAPDTIPKHIGIGSERHAEMLSTASEVLTVSPVPILVTESILQAKPKESISSETSGIGQEVLSSTVIPVQVSGTSCTESPTRSENEVQLNGTVAALEPEIKRNQDPVVALQTENTSEKLIMETEQEQSMVQSEEPESGVEAASTEQLDEEPSLIAKEDTPPSSSESIIEESKVTEAVEEKASTQELQTQATSTETSIETSIDTPIRPTRMKELNIPATPTVTEPTPPTSPPVLVPEDTVKKVSKKAEPEGEAAETTEADNSEKKTKKVVKKVVKKPKIKSEESQEEASEGSSKQKKTVKITKKSTKSLAAEMPVPETPPPGSTEAPVPPKRKPKSSTAKSTSSKKPDAE